MGINAAVAEWIIAAPINEVGCCKTTKVKCS